MRRLNSALLRSISALVLVLGALPLVHGQVDSTPTSRPKLPDIAMVTLVGEKWKLSDSQGKPLVVNFWATWCEPCRTEIPYLLKLSEEFKSTGLKVVGVNLDKERDDRVTKFIAEFKIDYSIVVPPDGSPFWELEELPITLLIDAEGRLVRRYTGAVPEDKLRQDISALVVAESVVEVK